MLPLRCVQAPHWVLSGAKYDLDFANNRYWGGAVVYGACTTSYGRIQSLVSGPQNSVSAAYAPDSNGLLVPAAVFVPRITKGCGLWVNRASTNSALWCRDLTNVAWTKTSITATKNQTGADGVANSATSLTASAANGTCLQSITLASAASVTSAYVKRLTGSGVINMTQDNGTTWAAITSSINSGGYTQVKVPSATVLNPTVGFQIVIPGDAIAVDFVQQEGGVLPTTPLLTTTVAVVRSNEEPSFNDPSGSFTSDGLRLIKEVFVNGSPWAVCAAYSGSPVGSGFLIASDGPPNIGGGCDGGVFKFQGASTVNTGTSGLGNINKVCGRVNGQGAIAVMNGGALSSYATGGTNVPQALGTAITHCGLGNNGAGTSYGPLDVYISRLTLWSNNVPSDGHMIDFTR